jgi:hypothetical protein
VNRGKLGTGLAVAVCLVIGWTTAATTAVASPVVPGDAKRMLRSTDLADHYGHVTRTYADVAKGGHPTACQNPVTGKAATPTKAAQRTLIKEIGFPAGIVWQNAVFVYPSPAAAQTAYRELAREAGDYCNMSKDVNIGTDGDQVNARVTLKTASLPSQAGVARFGVAYSTNLDRGVSVNPMYADSYDYSVYAVDGRVISRVGILQVARIGAVERTDAQAAAVAVARRVVALAP